MTNLGIRYDVKAHGLAAIERELSSLHAEMLSTAKDGAEFIRSSVLNLVAVCFNQANTNLALTTVNSLAQAHPARAIIIEVKPNENDNIEADLSLQCNVYEGNKQICLEQVYLRVDGEPSGHIESIILPLLVSDVPTLLWYVGAPNLNQVFKADNLELYELLIIDSAAYADPIGTLKTIAAAQSKQKGVAPLVDLAWNRNYLWRKLIAEAFHHPDLLQYINSISKLSIESYGDEPATHSWLLAGWLSAQLKWSHESKPQVNFATRPVQKVVAGRLHKVEISCNATSPQASVIIEREGEELVTIVEINNQTHSSSVTSVRRTALVDLVTQHIEDSAVDKVYLDALQHAIDLNTQLVK